MIRSSQGMLEAARQALANAHAPYSHFRVGAAIRTGSGRVYQGCNVENSSYPVTQCAEATAIGAMVAGGDRQIVEILVATESAELCAPCGRCRQQLAEFARADVPVHLAGPEGVRRTITLGELLPLAFGPEILGRRPDGGSPGA